jgi:hypothetical protein
MRRTRKKKEQADPPAASRLPPDPVRPRSAGPVILAVLVIGVVSIVGGLLQLRTDLRERWSRE